MTRPRRAGNKDMPDNLYRYRDPRTGRDYYRYRDPRTGKFHGLGTNPESATADAIALNAAVLAQLQTRRLETIAQPATPTGKTWGFVTLHHLELAEKLQARGKIAANTLKSKRSLVNRWTAALVNTTPIGSITVLDVAKVLNDTLAAGKERQAQSLRSDASRYSRPPLPKDGQPTTRPRAPAPSAQT